MAASDEYPRGYTFTTSFGPGTTPALVIPAASGITHVVTAVGAIFINASGSPGPFSVLQLTDLITALVLDEFGNTPTGTRDSILWTGKFSATVGQLIKASLSAAVAAGSNLFLHMEWYDI